MESLGPVRVQGLSGLPPLSVRIKYNKIHQHGT